jgi:hypothetical protein
VVKPVKKVVVVVTELFALIVVVANIDPKGSRHSLLISHTCVRGQLALDRHSTQRPVSTLQRPVWHGTSAEHRTQRPARGGVVLQCGARRGQSPASAQNDTHWSPMHVLGTRV